MDNSFGKPEKLKSRKEISKLFTDGKVVKNFPLKIVYLPAPSYQEFNQLAFSVPKRGFKKAVDRNRVKRLLRESYRLSKNKVFAADAPKYNLLVIYLGNTIPTYTAISQKLYSLLEKIV